MVSSSTLASNNYSKLLLCILIFIANCYIIKRMRIITRKPIEGFKLVHPDSSSSLDSWYELMKENDFNNFIELKSTFGSVDVVGKGYVFNISGNKYRLASSIHFNAKRVYIREIMTHAEYSQEVWKRRHQDFS
jgi:mRNA interferase HigB